MLLHISKVLANYQVLKTIPLCILEDDAWTEPTVDEVFDFGESIKLPRIEVKPGYPHWFNALHEVGHWAVKPEWYIEEWGKLKKSCYGVPHIEYSSDFRDLTPDEFGVRAWSHLVLTKKHWRYPTRCYSEDFSKRHCHKSYMQKQWLDFGKKPFEPVNGFEQLDFAGIDIERDIYRPDPQFCRRHFIYGGESNRTEKYAA